MHYFERDTGGFLIERETLLMRNRGIKPKPYMRCRCAKCRTRNKSGLVWERHPDGVWRKRNTTQRKTNE